MLLAMLLVSPCGLANQPRVDRALIPPDVSPQLRELIEQLYTGDRPAQIQATRGMGALGEEGAAAVPFLVTMLWGKADINGAAHQALTRIGKPSLEAVITSVEVAENRYIFKHVLEILDEQRDERATEALAMHLYQTGDGRALNILAHIGQPAVDRLLAMLAGPNAPSRAAAARALVLSPTARVCEALAKALGDDSPWVRGAAMDALGTIQRLTEGAVCPPLSLVGAGTKDADAATRRAAYGILASLTSLGKANYLPQLVEAFRDEDLGVQMTSLRAIASLAAEGKTRNQGEILGAQARPALTEALRDVDPAVRARAAEVVAILEQKDLLAAVEALLKDESGQVRISAVRALGRMKVTRAAGQIGEAVKDQDHDVRKAAAEVLGDLGDKSVIPLLKAALEENDDDIAFAMKTALAKLEGAELPKPPEPWDARFRRGGRREEAPVVKPFPPMILEPPEPPAAFERRPPPEAARNKISGGPPPPASPDSPEKKKFFAMLNTRDTRLRDKAAEAAAGLPQGGIAFLREALRSDNLYLRDNAFYIIVKNKLVAAAADLLGLLNHRDGRTQDAALAAFVSLKGEAQTMAYLEEALKDGGKRERAVRVLGSIGDAAAADALGKMLSDPDWRVRRLAVDGLGNAKAAAGLAKALHDPYWCVRVYAADRIAIAGCREAVPALAEALLDEHWYVRTTAHAALIKVSGRELPPEREAWRKWWETEGRNAPPPPPMPTPTKKK